MGRLDNFEIYTRNSNRKIFISITAYGLTFSKGAVEALDYPQYVHVLFDKNTTSMAIKSCEKDRQARVFVKNRNANRASFVRWNDKKLINFITQLGNLELASKGVRIQGDYFDDENVLIFNLKDYSFINYKNNFFQSVDKA